MSWALGIGIHERALMAEVRQAGGGVKAVSLSKLADDGLPSEQGSTLRLTTDFRDWSEVEFGSYSTGFVTFPDKPQHQVFRFADGLTQVVMPALVVC